MFFFWWYGDHRDLRSFPTQRASNVNGIAQRNFTTKIALGAYVEVVGASMSDGILTIKLETHIPDEKKPKMIEVN